jgi:putative FmdB family regulatory protein
MPLYEYECTACGNRFERIQKFSDPLVQTCPKCEGAVRKLMSSPAIQFKGSGWYITDYAKKSGTAAGDNGDKRDKAETSDKAEKRDGGGDKKAGGDSAAASSEKPSAPASPPPSSSSSPTKSE